MVSRTRDSQGLTSRLTPPLIAPARVRFRDVQTGRWIEGVSEPKINNNDLRMFLDIKAYTPCRYAQRDRLHKTIALFRARGGRFLGLAPSQDGSCCDVCGTPRELIGERSGQANLLTNVFAKLVQAGHFGTTTTITDTGSTGRSVTKTLDGGMVAASTLVCAGTGGTSATVADTNMQTQTESIANPTVNAVSGSGSSGTFTVVGVITATADRAYQECGIKVVTTTAGWIFLIAHDSFSTLNVSNTGTLSTTYTLTNS